MPFLFLLFENLAKSSFSSKFSLESLILAQNERWRRGLGMQVGRSCWTLSPQGQGVWQDSGKRVSNTWVIYPRNRDNLPKGGLIPSKTTALHGAEVKDGDRKAYRLRRSPCPISLLAG